MSENEYERPSREKVERLVKENIEQSEYQIHGIIPCGANDLLWFYLVVWSQPHREVDDATMLNERYFQIPRDWSDEYSPTFKTNGINRRNMGELAGRLAHIYAEADNAAAHRTDWLAKDDVTWLGGDE